MSNRLQVLQRCVERKRIDPGSPSPDADRRASLPANANSPLSSGVFVVLPRSLCFSAVIFSFACPIALADDWPQWRGPQRDGVWREDGIVEHFESEQLPHVWRVPIGPGYSGPTVADGRVFVTDRLIEPRQMERVHCFDWKTGRKIWSHEYEAPYDGISYTAGPRASVTIDDDNRAYALGATGRLHCFDAGAGAVLWKRDLRQDYDIDMPIWGIAGAPLAYDELLILHIGGRNGACVVALDRKSGEEVWRALNDRAQYTAPVIVEQAGQNVCVVWTGDSV
ncbi:MAG: PQQ-binding-like beta-propeller repeat protein, partial [Planctomycetes bacterium]|nr:PQQ-binding-like beta-propeller repeat protein [Planctomycetota bacterium]